MKELINETKIKVRFSEVDSVGFVWHGHYVKYIEDGREAWGREFGFSYMDMYRNKFVAPIVKVDIDYKSPLKTDDEAIIKTEYVYTKAAKIIFNFTITNAKTGNIVVKAQTIQVFMDLNENLLLTNPEFVEKWQQMYLFE
jgi:acyl-CoA thioester hydrolase